jgi:hypothetical protein
MIYACAFFMALGTLAAYCQVVWEYQDYYIRPRNDTTPLHQIERPTPPAEAA